MSSVNFTIDKVDFNIKIADLPTLSPTTALIWADAVKLPTHDNDGLVQNSLKAVLLDQASLGKGLSKCQEMTFGVMQLAGLTTIVATAALAYFTATLAIGVVGVVVGGAVLGFGAYKISNNNYRELNLPSVERFFVEYKDFILNKSEGLRLNLQDKVQTFKNHMDPHAIVDDLDFVKKITDPSFTADLIAYKELMRHVEFFKEIQKQLPSAV